MLNVSFWEGTCQATLNFGRWSQDHKWRCCLDPGRQILSPCVFPPESTRGLLQRSVFKRWIPNFSYKMWIFWCFPDTPNVAILHWSRLHCVVLIVGICLGIKEQSVPLQGDHSTSSKCKHPLLPYHWWRTLQIWNNKLLLLGETYSHRSALFIRLSRWKWRSMSVLKQPIATGWYLGNQRTTSTFILLELGFNTLIPY